MGQVVTNSASIQCTFGVAPSVLTVLPANKTMASSQPAAAPSISTASEASSS